MGKVGRKQNSKTIFIDFLPCAQHCDRLFINAHINTIRWSFYPHYTEEKGRNRSPKNINSLSKITQL